jgi:AcrR family transcriptional regulator
MSRQSAQARREEILRATVDQIAERGLAPVRVADVASSLGISTALVFYHFDTKERLVAEAFAYASARDLELLDATVAAAGDPLERLVRVLELYAPTGEQTSWRLWIEAWGAAIAEPEIREAWARLDRRWKVAVEQVIADAAATGAVECDDPSGTAWRLSALMDGLAVQAVVGDGLSRQTLHAWVRRHAALELGIDPERLRG